MTGAGTRLLCAGCGEDAGTIEDRRFPFRCAAAREGDDIDHVIRRVLDPERVRFPAEADPNPFIRYRTLMHSWHLAMDHGLGDEAYREIVASLDASVASVDGHGFAVTPFGPHGPLGETLGFGPHSLWIKDETRNVSGSHKARHLMGLALYLEVVERVGAAAAGAAVRQPPRATLAVASCGNAALAAAVVARAARRPLRVFVPPDANAAVLGRLRTLDAQIVMCPREDGVAGDPCYLRFREFVGTEGLAFCCQGSDNGLTIEGGVTLGYEMIDGLGDARLDRLFVQVGGGALASACIQAFTDAQQVGRLARLPRLYTVQTRGAFPLKRAYDRVVARIHARSGSASSSRPEDDETSANVMLRETPREIVDEALAYARHHRSEFMWSWETEPRSVASGILDDETYDWAAVVEGMVRTGGYPIVVDEDTLIHANAIARSTTGIDVDHTGSAGLAGLMAFLKTMPAARAERAAIIFSGVRR